jgi:hypothetical protein
LIDIDHASVKGPLPWGDVYGKEIVLYFADLDQDIASSFFTDSNGLKMTMRQSKKIN